MITREGEIKLITPLNFVVFNYTYKKYQLATKCSCIQRYFDDRHSELLAPL